jgi:hypothetical protein
VAVVPVPFLDNGDHHLAGDILHHEGIRFVDLPAFTNFGRYSDPWMSVA